MLESSKVYENEIIKAEDVDFAFLQTIMNSAVVKGLLERTDVDMIVSGGQITQVAPMVLSVNRLFCIGQTLQVPIFLDQQSDDIQIPLADANQYRIDILEVIPEIQSFNHVQRAFYDPSLDAEQFTTVATKRRNRAVFVVKSGTPGLGTAPLTDDGYVKLAELIIPPLATELPPENILPVTAPVPGAANELWTSEPARTMFLGGIDTLKQQVIDSNTQTLEAANEYTDQRVAASENVDYIGKWPLESTLPHLADNPALRNGSTYGLENCDITAEGYSGLAKYESANDSWDIYPDMTLRMDQETITLRESDGAYQVNPVILESYGEYTDGRNLLDVLGVSTIADAMALIHTKCNGTGKPNFYPIQIGDYLDLTNGLTVDGTVYAWNASYQNLRLVVSGFNTFKAMGSTENAQNHILFTFRNCPLTRQMNTSNVTDGGYPAMPIKAYLDGVFATGLNAALGGNYIYPVQRYIPAGYNSGNTWYTGSVWLPTEVEVFGNQIFGVDLRYGTSFTPTTATPIHFPIFQKSFTYRVKRYNGSRQYWWLATPYYGSSSHFCYVISTGNAGNYGAAHAHGIAPAFCVS